MPLTIRRVTPDPANVDTTPTQRRVAMATALVAYFSLLAIMAILTWQIYFWARFGRWQPIAVSDAFRWLELDQPQTSWLGVQQAIDWWLGSPLTISGLMVVVLLVVVAVDIGK